MQRRHAAYARHADAAPHHSLVSGMIHLHSNIHQQHIYINPIKAMQRTTHAAPTQLTQHTRTHAAPTQHPRSTHAAPTQHSRITHLSRTTNINFSLRSGEESRGDDTRAEDHGGGRWRSRQDMSPPQIHK